MVKRKCLIFAFLLCYALNTYSLAWNLPAGELQLTVSHFSSFSEDPKTFSRQALPLLERIYNKYNYKLYLLELERNYIKNSKEDKNKIHRVEYLDRRLQEDKDLIYLLISTNYVENTEFLNSVSLEYGINNKNSISLQLLNFKNKKFYIGENNISEEEVIYIKNIIKTEVFNSKNKVLSLEGGVAFTHYHRTPLTFNLKNFNLGKLELSRIDNWCNNLILGINYGYTKDKNKYKIISETSIKVNLGFDHHVLETIAIEGMEFKNGNSLYFKTFYKKILGKAYNLTRNNNDFFTYQYVIAKKFSRSFFEIGLEQKYSRNNKLSEGVFFSLSHNL